MCKMIYPTFGPKKSKHVLTAVPGVTKLNGPAVPDAQIDVFVLHCEYDFVVMNRIPMINRNILMNLITTVRKM